jgi:hypothetical protein
MARGKASGYSLTTADARIVLGMQARGDRDHDIAAWFGVNQGRIAEVKEGRYGAISAAPAHELPPKGPPGIKGRRLRKSVQDALTCLNHNPSRVAEAISILETACKTYDAHEA